MHKKLLVRYFLIITIITAITSINQAQQKLANIGDFITVSGDTITNCTLGYRTFGKLNEDSSNVIIYPSWFGGTSEHVGCLVAPGKLLDPTDHFVIVIDALSNGISSSPSNYAGGNKFPEITIRDMVKSEYQFLNKHLGFKSVYGAIGGSMGSMQVFEWVTMYPEYIKKAVAYVSTPKPTAHDLLQWNIRLEIIDSYRKLGATDKQIQKLLNMQSSLMARSPGWNADNINRDEFDKFLTTFNGEPDSRFTVDNYRSQLIAMLSHNIYTHYNGSIEETVKAIQTDLLLIVSETDHLVHPKSAIEFAELSGAKIFLLKNNSGHLGISEELGYCSKLINDFFNN
jgi:homoserine O-acetyltransferase